MLLTAGLRRRRPAGRRPGRARVEPHEVAVLADPDAAAPGAAPSGKLIADIRQSSRDGAANRFQVWINNDTDTPITPTKVTYHDDRFRTALPGTRLRDIPSQSSAGFPFYQPDRPACGEHAPPSGTVDRRLHRTASRERVTVPVEDEADVVQRIAAARCLELAIDKVAHAELGRRGDGRAGTAARGRSAR